MRNLICVLSLLIAGLCFLGTQNQALNANDISVPSRTVQVSKTIQVSSPCADGTCPLVQKNRTVTKTPTTVEREVSVSVNSYRRQPLRNIVRNCKARCQSRRLSRRCR